jgi:hypothetical protein
MKPCDSPAAASVYERALDSAGIENALDQATRVALREHAVAGRKVPIWRDGGIVWVLPTLEGQIPAAPALPTHR